MGARTKGRAAAATVAFASVAAAGAVMAAPASADVSKLEIDNSALLGSLDQRYGASCGYGVIATVPENSTENVVFSINGNQVGSIKPDGGKAVYPWFPFAPGQYTIKATQGTGDEGESIGPLNVGVGVYTGSSCIILY
ncbi:hypothetical protein VX037_11755 [Gordonia sp. Z-3]|uniref:hypothetical protein n=1 Tax=Gordonia sp. Z-3 TaxID=3115408 RepID=UPI002E2E3A6D|nr:hypothetical protein [Gordonia sp. Z-3]MED5801702.1 hypothetical protein [Gordonia sp. Z-3]